jgi:glycosyltransferase involved in cell wall biosynthesis
MLDQPTLRDLYGAADLLVLPGVGEGLPMVILEALACGTPVLTTRATAAGAGEGACLLATAERTSDAFERAAVDLLRSADDRREWIAREAARRWDWDGIVVRYLELLAQIV